MSDEPIPIHHLQADVKAAAALVCGFECNYRPWDERLAGLREAIRALDAATGNQQERTMSVVEGVFHMPAAPFDINLPSSEGQRYGVSIPAGVVVDVRRVNNDQCEVVDPDGDAYSIPLPVQEVVDRWTRPVVWAAKRGCLTRAE